MTQSLPRRAVWMVIAGLGTIVAFAWVFRNVDLDTFATLIVQSDPRWVFLVGASIVGEQLVRGWKWRQLLFDMKPVSSLRLFGAVVAGYFANIIAPIGVSPFVRSWLIARLERLHFATVVMTTAIERFVDGVVFAVLVMIVALGAAVPTASGDLRTGLVVASIGGFILFGGLLALLFVGKRSLVHRPSSIRKFLAWMSSRFGQRFAGLDEALAGGIVWPRSRWRAVGVVLASITMKAISVTHFLWAGMAIGVVLGLYDYMFLTVFAGISLIVARFIRVPGGFVIGSAYGLKLLGVADEQALAMVLLVHLSSLATTIVFGALALWVLGFKIQDIRNATDKPDHQTERQSPG